MAVKIGEFPLVIRTMRKKAGLTQRELADLAGVGKTLIFDIEKGRQTVSLTHFLKICRALNIDLTLTPPISIDLDSVNKKTN